MAGRGFRLSFINQLVALCAALCCAPALADPIHGQHLFVPVHSAVYFGDDLRTVDLTVTLSVRNTDSKNVITIQRVDYLNSSGTRVRAYLERPAVLKPLASVQYIVKESDRHGGTSASFLVDWESESAVSPPVVDALMVSSYYNRALAFSAEAKVLSEKP